MSEAITGTGKTLEEWREFACKDNCLDYMVPSELRSILGALSRTRYDILENVAIHFDQAAQDKHTRSRDNRLYQDQADILNREGDDLDEVAETIREMKEDNL